MQGGVFEHAFPAIFFFFGTGGLFAPTFCFIVLINGELVLNVSFTSMANTSAAFCGGLVGRIS